MADQTLVHIDTGVTKSMSYLTGEKQSVVRLCGATDGDYIHDDDISIRLFGGVPAGCTCGDCRQVARIMHLEYCTAEKARESYQVANK